MIEKNIWNVKLNDKRIEEIDEYGIFRYLRYIGFENVRQLLNMRVFDLMNMNHIGVNDAEQIIYILYRCFNYNRSADEAMHNGSRHQTFDYGKWRSEHKSYSKVTVKDICLSKNINEKAIAHIFRNIAKVFFKSPEYNAREYMYLDYKDYEKHETR